MPDDAAGAAPAHARVRRVLVWMLVYAIVVAIIVFWPQPFLSVFDPWIRKASVELPALTLPRVEFAANIAMFVPLGMFLAVLLPRRRYLVAPIGFVTTIMIESVQGLFLSSRSATVADVLANTTGACLGLLIIEIVEAVRRRKRPSSP
ncbi:VanZ family protein [Microbacterium sp. 22242]|uniref:VanZ family protein n=1 Tax=Microbacterium sp. 22242 TaxID=3453896 RepID=UPI003F82C9E1